MKRVFVYGTLKSGQPNHYQLKDGDAAGCRMMGLYRTEETFPLVVAGRYNIPFLLNQPRTGQHVEGEIYEVDAETLSRLDKLENVPHVYERVTVKVVPLAGHDDPHTGNCWTYMIHNFRPELLNLPMLLSFKTDGPYGKYVPPWDRSKNGPKPHWSDVLASGDEEK